jgi:hypothetical protein
MTPKTGVEVLPPVKDDKKARAEANQLHTEAAHEVSSASQSIVRLGKLVAKLKDPRYRRWELVSVKGHKNGFKSWGAYSEFLLGPISRGKLYELVEAASLTEGPNALPAKTVRELGVKKAVEVARLKPKDRTPAVIQTIRESSLPKAKHVVQTIINMDLPEEDRREATVAFMRNLPTATAELMEELELDGQYMEGMRDSDTSVTLRGKFWHYVCVDFRERHKADLAEGKKFRLAMEAKNAKASASKKNGNQEEEEIIPPGPETHTPHSAKIH